MTETTAAPTTTSVVVETASRRPKPRRHHLEENPPPPIRAFSIGQIEAEHPGIKGRLRGWIKRADAGDEAFRWLKLATIRVADSVLIDDIRFRAGLYERTAFPPRPARNTKPAAKAAA